MVAMSSATTSPITASLVSVRLPIVDVLRGLAIAQMIVYHFIYDLDYFRWIDLAMTRDQPWVAWRTAIVSQFLLLIGVSLVLRTSFKPDAADFWRRWLQVAGAALLVSAGSGWMFGERLIFFGILHFAAAALLLTRPLLRLGPWLIVAGIAAVAAGVLLRHEFFMQTGWNVLGFVPKKPRTEDYVPIFPWIGVVLIGAGLAVLWRRNEWRVWPAVAALNNRPPRLLRWLGQWPLTIYLLHQPIFLGALWLVKRMT
jgi:uncharacterized membrane protein